MRIYCGFLLKRPDLWLDPSHRVQSQLSGSHVNPAWLLNVKRDLQVAWPVLTLPSLFFCQRLLRSAQPEARGRAEKEKGWGEREQKSSGQTQHKLWGALERNDQQSTHTYTHPHTHTHTLSHTQVFVESVCLEFRQIKEPISFLIVFHVLSIHVTEIYLFCVRESAFIYSVCVCTSALYHLNNNCLFFVLSLCHPSFTQEGEIWPNITTQFVIVFKPEEAKLYQETVYCDITGQYLYKKIQHSFRFQTQKTQNSREGNHHFGPED